MTTKEKLASALEEAGLEMMARDARTGLYSDFESPLAFPKIALVRNLLNHGKHDLVNRVKAGEFDDTNDEARRAEVQRRFTR